MNKSRIFLCVLWILLCVSIVVLAIETGEAKYTLKFAHNEAIGSTVDKALQEVKQRIEAETNGEVEVLLFPAGQLGETPQLAEMISMGNLQIAIGSPANISGVVPVLQVYDIPFLLPESLEDATEVINSEPVLKIFSDSLEKANIKALAFYTFGVKQFTSNFPIHKPEDMKGHKMRVMKSPLLIETFKVWGASPTPIPYAETYTALQLGTVDGQENPIHAIYQMKFFEVQDYLTLSNHSPFTLLCYVNVDWFDSLPEEYQTIIFNAIQDSVSVVLEETAIHDEEALEMIKEESDIEIVTLTAEERLLFKDVLDPVRQKYIDMFGEEGKAILDAIKEESSKK